MAAMEEKKVDRMSELPEDVVQHIQSFLDLKYGTQSTLVSKSWLRAWSTRPFLNFTLLPSNWNAGINIDLVIKNTLQSHHQNGIPILKFRNVFLAMEDKWVKLVLQNNLIELDIYISRCYNEVLESVWRQIFMKKSLQHLKVWSRVNLVLSHRDIKCHNLKILALHFVQIDDATFQHVTRYCPLIEDLCLYGCKLLKFRASNLPNLKFLELGRVEIRNLQVTDAPRLQSFTVIGEVAFNIGACASLKVLSLQGSDINDEQLQSVLSKNLQLEDLTVLWCDKLVKRINVSCLSGLKRFHFVPSWNQQQQEAIIDAPNLHRLKYRTFCGSPFPITSPITKAKVNVTIAYYGYRVDESWFHGLGEFLTKFAQPNVKIILINHWCSFEELRATPLPHPHQVETLTFKRRFPCLPVLYAFFTLCHPKTVFFKNDQNAKSNYLASLRKLWEALIYTGNLECCKLDRNKRWRHYIKDAKLYHVVHNEQKPLDINELIVGSNQMVIISLRLEWRECSD